MKRKLKKVETTCRKLKCLIAAGEAEYFRSRNTELIEQLSKAEATIDRLKHAFELLKRLDELRTDIRRSLSLE